MSLTYNAVKLVLRAKNLSASFERPPTIAHQGLSCSPRQLRRAVHDFGFTITPEQISRCFRHPPGADASADAFLHFLGAKGIVSAG